MWGHGDTGDTGAVETLGTWGQWRQWRHWRHRGHGDIGCMGYSGTSGSRDTGHGDIRDMGDTGAVGTPGTLGTQGHWGHGDTGDTGDPGDTGAAPWVGQAGDRLCTRPVAVPDREAGQGERSLPSTDIMSVGGYQDHKQRLTFPASLHAQSKFLARKGQPGGVLRAWGWCPRSNRRGALEVKRHRGGVVGQLLYSWCHFPLWAILWATEPWLPEVRLTPEWDPQTRTW